jgi:uncharacterized protein YceH (UPF0502 family)
MNTVLNEVEVRVAGALIEKQVCTPEYYPLTLNALVHACNQTSNREPVVSFDEGTVMEALDSLREKNLAYIFYGSESRVPKYKHVMTEIFNLSPAELAIICVLMLRGAQTIGEIRGRTNRLYDFSSLAEAEATLEALMTRDDQPLVLRLPRQPGQKEARYAHLLSGEIQIDEQPKAVRPQRSAAATMSAENERVSRLESEVEVLRGDLDELRQQFSEFKKQFE